MRIALLAAAATAMLATGLAASSVEAQRPERILRIFGDDKCPANEICITAPETERYRDPLRENAPAQPQAVLNQKAINAMDSEGKIASGIDSCSPSGAGGATGCFRQRVRNAREEDRQNGKPANIEF